jgi:hypothetical protein
VSSTVPQAWIGSLCSRERSRGSRLWRLCPKQPPSRELRIGRGGGNAPRLSVRHYNRSMGAPLPVDKPLTIAAAICGAAGLGIGIATGSAPLMVFAGNALGNVFANLGTDACKAASDHYKLIAAGPGAPAQNHDLALLAAKAISAVVEEAMRDFDRDRAGFGFLQSAAALKPAIYEQVLALPEFREVGTDKLVQFLGLPEGGITVQAASDSIWYALIVAALRQSNPRGDLSALNEMSTHGISFAAQRLWERFPSQYNGELRNDPKYGGRAWVAFQSTMMKRSVEAAEATRAELKSHRQEWRTFADRVNAVLDSILAGEFTARLAADDPVVVELRQTRNLVGSIYARLDLLEDKMDGSFAKLESAIASSSVKRWLLAEDSILVDSSESYFCTSGFEDIQSELFQPRNYGWTKVLHGMKGIGKSLLAFRLQAEYVRRGGFSCVLRLGTDDERTADFRTLSELVGLDVSAGQSRLAAVVQRVAQRIPSGNRWLCVLDDVPDVTWLRDNLIFPANLDLIITTNWSEWSGWNQLPMLVFTPEDSLAFLMQQLGREWAEGEEADAVRVATELDNHPMALSLFAACTVFQGMTVGQLAAQFTGGAAEVVFDEQDARTGKVPATLWNKAFTLAEQGGATDLLARLSLCDGASVPLDLVAPDKPSGGSGSSDTVDAEVGTLRVARQLHRLSLLRFQPTNTTAQRSPSLVSIHRLVQQAFQAQRPRDVDRVKWAMVERMTKVFTYEWEDPPSYARAMGNWPHAQRLLESMKVGTRPPHELLTKFFELLGTAHTFEYFDKRFTQSLRYSDWQQAIGGDTWPMAKERVEYLHSRASVLMHLRKFTEAIDYARRVRAAVLLDSDLNEAEKRHKCAGFKGCEGCVHRFAGTSTDALRCYEDAAKEMLGVADLDHLDMEQIRRIVPNIPEVSGWARWRTVGGALTNLAIELKASGQIDRALRLISLACECYSTDSTTKDHVWRGLAFYHAWDIARAGREPAETCARLREEAAAILSNRVPRFTCMGDVDSIRGELGLNTPSTSASLP